ncbi:MAG TPA: hypothetical protein VJ793_22520 [Anaerolineae bacterium]|nr:hypothetical protein [Anaerolineae bacterium]
MHPWERWRCLISGLVFFFAIVLDDYRHWVDEMDGLTPGYD